MKKILILMLLIVTKITFGTELFVFPFATGENSYPTIQQAVQAANDGDKIIITPGSYYGDLNLNKQISIVSSSDEKYKFYGNVEFTSSTVLKEINISNGEFFNSIEKNFDPNAGYYKLNFINCEFHSIIDIRDRRIISNYYYCKFSDYVYVSLSEDFIGCEFGNASLTSEQTINLSFFGTSNTSDNYTFENNGINSVKFIANKFWNTKIKFDDGYFNGLNFINFKNNFMYSNQYTSGYQNPIFAFFDVIGTTPSIFFHNNILYSQSNNSSSSELLGKPVCIKIL